MSPPCGRPSHTSQYQSQLSQLNHSARHQHSRSPPKRIHACDVVRNIYIILTKGGILKQCFAQDDMPLAMGIIAAAVHDYEHRGVNVSAGGVPSD